MRSPPLMILSVTLSGCALLGRGLTPAAPADPETPQASEDAPGRTRPRPYRRVITEEAVTRTGLFDVHRVGDALYFEVPTSALGRAPASQPRSVRPSFLHSVPRRCG